MAQDRHLSRAAKEGSKFPGKGQRGQRFAQMDSLCKHSEANMSLAGC